MKGAIRKRQTTCGHPDGWGFSVCGGDYGGGNSWWGEEDAIRQGRPMKPCSMRCVLNRKQIRRH